MPSGVPGCRMNRWKCPVLARLGAMGMIVILAMGFIVEHIVLRIVFELVEGALVTQHLAHDVEPAFAQHAITFQNARTGFGHGFEAGRVRSRQVEVGYGVRPVDRE